MSNEKMSAELEERLLGAISGSGTTYINVGFRDDNSIKMLRDMMMGLEKTPTKISEKRKIEQIQKETLKYYQDYPKKIDKHFHDVNDKLGALQPSLISRSVTMISNGIKAILSYVAKGYVQADEMVSYMKKMNQAGLSMPQSLNNMKNLADEIGIKMENLEDILGKYPTTFNRFLIATDNGAKQLGEIFSKMRNDYGMTAKETSAMINSYIESRHQMDNQLNTSDMDKWVKNVKMMAYLEGKSAEQKAAELKEQERDARIKAFNIQNPAMIETLKSLGMDDKDFIEYIISGGVITNANQALKFAGNTLYKNTLDTLIQSKGEITGNVLSTVLQASQYDRGRSANILNPGIAIASGFSDPFKSLLFGNMMTLDETKYNKAIELLNKGVEPNDILKELGLINDTVASKEKWDSALNLLDNQRKSLAKLDDDTYKKLNEVFAEGAQLGTNAMGLFASDKKTRTKSLNNLKIALLDRFGVSDITEDDLKIFDIEKSNLSESQKMAYNLLSKSASFIAEDAMGLIDKIKIAIKGALFGDETGNENIVDRFVNAFFGNENKDKTFTQKMSLALFGDEKKTISSVIRELIIGKENAEKNISLADYMISQIKAMIGLDENQTLFGILKRSLSELWQYGYVLTDDERKIKEQAEQVKEQAEQVKKQENEFTIVKKGVMIQNKAMTDYLNMPKDDFLNSYIAFKYMDDKKLSNEEMKELLNNPLVQKYLDTLNGKTDIPIGVLQNAIILNESKKLTNEREEIFNKRDSWFGNELSDADKKSIRSIDETLKTISRIMYKFNLFGLNEGPKLTDHN